MSGVKQAVSAKPLFRNSKSRQQTSSFTCNYPVTRSSVTKQNATEKKGLGDQFQGRTLNAGQQCAPTSVSVENGIEPLMSKKEVGNDLRDPLEELPSLKIKRKSLDRRTPGKRKKRRDSTTKLINREQPDNQNPSADAVDSAVDNSNKPIYCPQTVANFSIANSSSIDRDIAVNSYNPLNPLAHIPILGSDASCIKSSTPVRPNSATLTHVSGTSPPTADKNGRMSIITVNGQCGFSIALDNSSSNCLFDNSSFGRDDSALAAFDLSGVVSSYEAMNKPTNKNTSPMTELSSKSNQLDNDEAAKEKQSFQGEVKNERKSRFLEEFFGNDSLPEDNMATRQPKSDNSFYGLPRVVKTLLEQHRGISTFYDWQTDCLKLPAVIEGKNLIYSLPTSGGKTLVAEILIMKELLVKQKDALFILPFVSIVQEKVKSLTQFAVDLGFLVEEYAGSRGKIPPRKRRKKKSLYIATIEKANALVNSLIEDNRINEVGLVVVDELHMLGEGGGRGATLETCLSKLLFSTKATQIIGMSATLSNISDLKQFLGAEVFSSDFRPVELCEYFKISTSIYEVKASKFGHHEEPSHTVVRRVQHHKSKDKLLLMRDPDHLVPLVMEVIPKHSCLVFCPTKKNCQSLVEMLVSFMSREVKEVKVSERRELLRALMNQANGLCPTLKRVVPYGMAYHHSGLTMDERKLIEEAYKEGVLCLLTCTSTLAAGVNLPAKRVILRAPYVADSIISRSQYKQMIGRAGRAGIDTSGESILVLKETDKAKIGHLFAGPFDSCKSSLKYEGGKGLRALILNLVGLKLCSSRNDVKSFINCTLLAVQCQERSELENEISSALQSLIELGHLREKGLRKGDEVEHRLEVTELGQATFKGCVDIDKSPVIYEDIKKAQESLVLSNELHLLYLVTPLDMATFEPNWMVYFRQITLLNEVEQKAAETIGVSESFLSRRATGQRCSKDKVSMLVVRRFYLTLMLYRLLKEHTVWNVADTFQVTRGFAQNLLASASSFASCMVRFTEELKEFWAIKLLLEAMVKKLSYTASIELIPLLEVPGVKQARARQFYRAGYKTLQHLARADTDELMKQIDLLPRKQARQIVSAAKMLLEEKADALREEAEEMVALSSPSTST